MELTKKDKFINKLLKEEIFLYLKEFGETYFGLAIVLTRQIFSFMPYSCK